MFDKIKDLLSNWKISVTLVGGAVVIATVFGKCTFEPDLSPAVEAEAEEVETESDLGEESSVETTSEESVENSDENTSSDNTESNSE